MQLMLHLFYCKVLDIDNDHDNDNDKCFIKHKCIQTTVIQLNNHYMYRREKNNKSITSTVLCLETTL